MNLYINMNVDMLSYMKMKINVNMAVMKRNTKANMNKNINTNIKKLFKRIGAAALLKIGIALLKQKR
jgi:hypothetical protein